MNKLLYIMILSVSVFMYSCSDDENDSVFDYSVSIMSPDTDAKMQGDTIHIHVEFESGTNETVHHVNVRIYNADDESVIYNAPDPAHVHETSGSYGYHDDFVLSQANGVEGHTDWVLEAKVWGHEAGVEEVVETIEFHVHPN